MDRQVVGKLLLVASLVETVVRGDPGSPLLVSPFLKQMGIVFF